MNEPRRLKDITNNEFARALLTSVEQDEPESGAETRALAAIGVGAAVLTATAAASGAANAAGGVTSVVGSAAGAASSVAPPAVKVSSIFLLKWLGVVVVGASAAVGTVKVLGRGSATPAPPTGAVEAAASATAASSLADKPAVLDVAANRGANRGAPGGDCVAGTCGVHVSSASERGTPPSR